MDGPWIWGHLRHKTKRKTCILFKRSHWYFNGASRFYMILVQYRTYILYCGTKNDISSMVIYTMYGLTWWIFDEIIIWLLGKSWIGTQETILQVSKWIWSLITPMVHCLSKLRIINFDSFFFVILFFLSSTEWPGKANEAVVYRCTEGVFLSYKIKIGKFAMYKARYSSSYNSWRCWYKYCLPWGQSNVHDSWAYALIT